VSGSHPLPEITEAKMAVARPLSLIGPDKIPCRENAAVSKTSGFAGRSANTRSLYPGIPLQNSLIQGIYG
jgi:hypothetical protein